MLLAVYGEFHRHLARTVDWHLLARYKYDLRSRHQWHSYRNAGNFKEVAPGNAGAFVYLFVLIRIIVTHA